MNVLVVALRAAVLQQFSTFTPRTYTTSLVKLVLLANIPAQNIEYRRP